MFALLSGAIYEEDTSFVWQSAGHVCLLARFHDGGIVMQRTMALGKPGFACVSFVICEEKHFTMIWWAF